MEEQRYLYGWRWPGPDAHEATLQTVTKLWNEHADLPFPHVPIRDKADLVYLDSTVGGIGSTYLQRGGHLNPRHRSLLADCLSGLRFGYIGGSFETHWYFVRLWKIAELIAHDALPLIRLGGAGDADGIYRVFLAARNEMAYLPRLHADEETRHWITKIMIPQSQLWVAEHRGQVAGFAALHGSWLGHLYVHPEFQRNGVGTALLDRAKKVRSSLDLHLFQQNEGARRLYERHGFTLVGAGDGSDNEESLPDAHMRWQDSRQPPRSVHDPSLTYAFPDDLDGDVRTVIDLMPRMSQSPASFRAVVGEDRVAIPQRVYHPEIAPEGLSPRQQTILHCLFTRHHDGFVRQRHLRQIVTRTEPWVLPYILELAGDHVIEIVTEVHAALADLTAPGSALRQPYGRFVADNPDLLTLIEQRTASYWACHHRKKFPRLADYPGRRLVTALQEVAASASR
ncbi:GNAT family N-acetyltransferase [Nonomuraea sp. NPDC050680]|uniref:GNAT family N-acetyltransferase n=1 Tax=Nonomuraea sp. NPDC050680 TaxID=3154630 RepID=UPI0033CF4BDB